MRTTIVILSWVIRSLEKTRSKKYDIFVITGELKDYLCGATKYKSNNEQSPLW